MTTDREGTWPRNRPGRAGQVRVLDTVHDGIVEALGPRDSDGARIAVRRYLEVWSSLAGEG